MATNAQLVMRQGVFDTENKDYINFKRANITRWGVIFQIMTQLEKLLSQYRIQISYVDVYRLSQLSEMDQERYTKDELMSCITNRVQVNAAMENPVMKFKGPNGPVIAAIKIQTCWRRHKAHSAFAQLKFLMEKATIIQRKYRLYMLKKQTKEKVGQFNEQSR